MENWKVPKGYLEFMEKTLRGLFLGSNLEEFVRVVKDRFPDCPTEVCKELHSGHFQLKSLQSDLIKCMTPPPPPLPAVPVVQAPVVVFTWLCAKMRSLQLKMIK